MNIKVYTLNSFAKSADGGNPAGVVLEAETLSEAYMQQIAHKVGFSETAFVLDSDKAGYTLRFFTPTKEVDLCGHATIAAFFLLADKGIIKRGAYTQETKAGILNIEIQDERTVFMAMRPPQFFGTIDKAELMPCFNLKEGDFIQDLPIQVVSTGLEDIVVPIKDLKTLSSLTPNADKISRLCEKYAAAGMHVFTLGTDSGAVAQCRNFAPLYGIPEEAATGTSTASLSCYLFNYGRIARDRVSHLVFEQGYSMGRPSEILARLRISGDKIREVQIGGTAILTGEKEISI